MAVRTFNYHMRPNSARSDNAPPPRRPAFRDRATPISEFPISIFLRDRLSVRAKEISTLNYIRIARMAYRRKYHISYTGRFHLVWAICLALVSRLDSPTAERIYVQFRDRVIRRFAIRPPKTAAVQ